jgi:hypothetical protein
MCISKSVVEVGYGTVQRGHIHTHTLLTLADVQVVGHDSVALVLHLTGERQQLFLAVMCVYICICV